MDKMGMVYWERGVVYWEMSVFYSERGVVWVEGAWFHGKSTFCINGCGLFITGRGFVVNLCFP